ncbi:BLUF domain-containing protein [Hymenobacter jejuensis]|nr:BLUF domain-containing protein [Hymenobacter jejuensis]MBC6988871.1 BLUF domain-containing protein [Hymenobacter sp. BT491]
MSSAVQQMTDDELKELLLRAQANNQALGVTGLLLYSNGSIMQILEGQESVVQALYEKLLTDPRHTGVIKVADKAIEERSFAGWSMGFQPVAPEEFAQLVGYVDPDSIDFRNSGIGAADALLLQTLLSFVVTNDQQTDEAKG